MTAKDNVRVAAGLAMVLALTLLACRGGSPPGAEEKSPSLEPPSRPVILCVGTSLTAGLGLDPEQAYPALLQARVDAAGFSYRVINAGVSGETSAGAVRRMDWLLRQKVAVLVLETGANDGLRGQDPESTRANIQAVFDRAQQQQPPPRLVLAGMSALPNYGPEYAREFRALYPELARRNAATLVPFILEGVAGVPALNQADGIHPTAAGQEQVAENVWRVLQPLLRDSSS
jgi:acyl-CoA thioesterase-1